MRRLALFSAVALFYSITAVADPTHVSLTYPVGGETFAPGTHVKIEWVLQIPHDQQNWDLYFSPDGGSTWDAIQEDLPISLLSFDWTVPDIETTNGRIKVVQDNSGLDYVATCPDFSIEAVATTSDGAGSLPDMPVLMSSYPNPFGRSTSVRYSVAEPGRVTLEVYDLQGHIVRQLVDGQRYLGGYVETFDAQELPAGIYLYRLTTPSARETRVMIHTR